MTNRHGTAVREYPSELEIVTTRRFDAPIALGVRRLDEAGARAPLGGYRRRPDDDL